MNLFGRSALIQALLDDVQDGFVLLVGDSGTGKTAMLVELQQRSVGMLAPTPVRVNRAPGSLQSGLLESLAAAVALLAKDETTTNRVGRLLVEATKKVRDSRLKDLREAVGRHLLGVIRARLGDDLADLLGDFAQSISDSQNETLAARITAASDPDVVDEIISFIEAVQGIAENAPVVLALDDLDRLDDDDLRRLADVVDRLPSGTRLRGSFTTWHASSRQRSELLLMSGARSVPMSGLDAAAVKEWVTASGLDSVVTQEVLAATNGYPVHVQDAVELLRMDPSAKTLHALTPDGVVRARVAQSWRELDTATQIVAAKLAIYVDPLSTDRICRLLRIDEVAWLVVQMRLIDSGLMIRDATGWFHELRRRAIWDSVLTENLRVVAAEAATAELRGELEVPGASPANFVDFARVAALNPSLRAGTPGVAAAVDATTDELAIAAAALELIETDHGEKAIDADVLLRYARDVYDLSGSGVAALSRLATAGLMYVASNQDRAVAIPTWKSIEALQVVVGRAAERLGRVPVAQIASAVFGSALHPRLGPFDMAQYGIGVMSLQQGSEQVVSFHQRPKDGVVHFGQHAPGLFVRAIFGVVPIYAAVSYTSDADRDGAFDAVHGLETELWDEQLVVTEAVRLPANVVPSLRFARVVTWLDGRNFNASMLNPSDAHRELSVGEELQARLEVREFIRGRLSHFERLAYQLENATGYAYFDSADSTAVVELIGGDSVVRLGTNEAALPMTPYTRLRLAEELDLPRSQSVGTIEWRGGRGTVKDPVTSEIVHLQKRVASYNSRQTKPVLDFDEETLTSAILAEFGRRRADAHALIVAVPGMGLTEPSPRTAYVALSLDEPTPGWVPGAHAAVYSATLPSGDGEHHLVFAMTRHQQQVSHAPDEVLRSLFGIDADDALTVSWGNALTSLPSLLGYARDEVRFRYSQTT